MLSLIAHEHYHARETIELLGDRGFNISALGYVSILSPTLSRLDIPSRTSPFPILWLSDDIFDFIQSSIAPVEILIKRRRVDLDLLCLLMFH